jgi:hypothetical protein
MKTKVALLVSLIVTNLIWGFVFFGDRPDQDIGEISKKGIQIYTLNGTGDKWDLIDYQIIVTPDQIFRGNGELVYKGNLEVMKESDFLQILFMEKDHNQQYRTVLSSAVSGTGGTVLHNRKKDIGSILSPYEYHETLKTKANYETSIVEVTWTENVGKAKKETINLELHREVIMKDG